MKDCNNCTRKVYKGYSRNPRTGKESKKAFYCDECYERLSLRLSQTRAYSDIKLVKKNEITTGKHINDED